MVVDMSMIVSKLRNNKAPSWDQVTSEHLKNSGPAVISTLTWLINGIV